MENTVLLSYLGIVIVMIIAAIILGRSKHNSHISHDTMNTSDFVDLGSDDTHHDHQHGHADHSVSSDSSHVDSGS